MKITKEGLKGKILKKRGGTQGEALKGELKKEKTKNPKKNRQKDADLDYEVFLQ